MHFVSQKPIELVRGKSAYNSDLGSAKFISKRG